jgi:hypothetical protein
MKRTVWKVKSLMGCKKQHAKCLQMPLQCCSGAVVGATLPKHENTYQRQTCKLTLTLQLLRIVVVMIHNTRIVRSLKGSPPPQAACPSPLSYLP